MHTLKYTPFKYTLNTHTQCTHSMHTLNAHTQCTHSNTHSKGVGFKRKKQAFRKIIRGVDIQINFKIECSETRGFGGWPPCTLSPRFHSYVEDLFYVNISCIRSVKSALLALAYH